MTGTCPTCAAGIAMHTERQLCAVCGIHTALCGADDRGHVCVACIYQHRRRKP